VLPKAPLSCRILSQLLTTDYGKKSPIASIPSNQISLQKKAGFSKKFNNIIIIEFGSKPPDLRQISYSLYSSIMECAFPLAAFITIGTI